MNMHQSAEKCKSTDVISVGYIDRFVWKKAMLAQPNSVLNGTTKVVLTLLQEEMNTKTHQTILTYERIGQMTGLTRAAVKACCEKAIAAGWLEGRGRGGIARDEDGRAHGLAKCFTLAIPATAIARYEGVTGYENGLYVLRNPEIRAMKLAGTGYSHSHNTPESSPDISPEYSPTPEREEYSDSDHGREEGIDRHIPLTPSGESRDAKIYKSEPDLFDDEDALAIETAEIPLSGYGHEQLREFLSAIHASKQVKKQAFDIWSEGEAITRRLIRNMAANEKGTRREQAA